MRSISKAVALGTTLWALSLAACIGEIGGSGGTGGDDDGEGSGSGSGSSAPVVCEQARTYTGLGGNALEEDRPKIVASSDRMRIKPYAALSAEYDRVLGLTGFNTGAFAGVFGRPPARWFEEPQASASTIYSAFALAYDGCSKKTAAGGDFAMTPTATVGDRICRDFIRAAWQREATDDEASTCATFALSQTVASDPPQKRWAYTCASVLTSSEFIAF